MRLRFGVSEARSHGEKNACLDEVFAEYQFSL